jgi:hypothetical protein
MPTTTLPHSVPNRKIECAVLYFTEVEYSDGTYYYPGFALQWADGHNTDHKFPGDLFLSENHALTAALLRLRDKAGYTPDYWFDLEGK